VLRACVDASACVCLCLQHVVRGRFDQLVRQARSKSNTRLNTACTRSNSPVGRSKAIFAGLFVSRSSTKSKAKAQAISMLSLNKGLLVRGNGLVALCEGISITIFHQYKVTRDESIINTNRTFNYIFICIPRYKRLSSYFTRPTSAVRCTLHS
jgi:hypothetical protein